MNFFVCLPSSVSCCIINQWIQLADVARLDSAFCVRRLRSTLLDLFSSTECVIDSEINASNRRLLTWLLKRKIKVERFYIFGTVDVKLGSQYMKLLGSRVTTIIRERGCGDNDAAANIIQNACVYGNLTYVEFYCIPVSLLNAILSSSPFLKKLHFHTLPKDHEYITSSILLHLLTDFRPLANPNIVMQIISLCPNLRILDLHGIGRNFMDADIVTVAQQCRHLKSLSMSGLGCSPHGYIELSKLCSEIEILSLCYSWMISDEVIDSVAIHLKQLWRLNLKSCRALTNVSLDTLAIHCTSTLVLLWLSGNDGITGDAITQLKNKTPALHVHSLAVKSANDLVPSVNDYAVCTVLRIFHIPFNSLLPIITQCKLLQVLGIFPYGGVSEHYLDLAVLSKIISSCPHLHIIVVDAEDVGFMKNVLNAVGSTIAVIRNDCKESEVACLSVFPL